MPNRPFAEISIDFIAELLPSVNLESKQTCNLLLVVVDRFTKYTYYFAVITKLTVTDLAALLFRRVFKDYGVLDGITSDRGSLFTSKF